MRNTFYLLCAFILFTSATSANNNSSKDEDVEKRVETLLKKMTLEEKIGQMNQLHCENMPKLKEETRKGRVGSVMSITDPNIFNEVQRIAMEESRLGIPMINARDVIHGFKTIFPIPLGQAASFNPEIAEVGARVAAVEASAAGIRWTFAPMIDVTYDPRWGRISEGCGEDPYLTSVMGVAMIKGYQGNNMSNPTSIAACAKHFAGYGATEGGRDYNSTFITERRLRNLYLRPFEAAVKAGVATLMSSFNDNDGVPSSGNSFLLKQVLRNEWKSDGVVVSDWNSTAEMINHGFCADNKDVAMKATNAGTDIEMVSETYIKHLPELIKENKVSMQTIDNAVRNILRLKFRLGLFENPYTPDKRKEIYYKAEHLAAAQKAAEQSTVLLKNDKQTLPLSNNIKTILVVGPLADAPHEQLGTWVFDADKSHTQTPLKALQKMYADKVEILYEPVLAYSRDNNTGNLGKAMNLAQKADIILAFVGEESILSGEAHCLTNLNLQGAQSTMITELSKTGKPLVTIVLAGRPLTIGNEVNTSDALLYSFHPGTMGGPALVNLLFGKTIPSGKLPVTFPNNAGQIPMYYYHNGTSRPANGNEKSIGQIPVGAEQTALGNTSYYLDAPRLPLFPFGYGLSYSAFEYGNLKLSAGKFKKNATITLTFDLTNTGKYDATETAQLYFQDMAASVARPVKELAAFQRIDLKAGEKKTVTMTLPVENLAFWNYDMKKVVEPGMFNLWIGSNSAEGLKTQFEVTD